MKEGKNTPAGKYGRNPSGLHNNEKIRQFPTLWANADRHWRIIYGYSCFLQHPRPTSLYHLHSSSYPFMPFAFYMAYNIDGNCLLLVFVFHSTRSFFFFFLIFIFRRRIGNFTAFAPFSAPRFHTSRDESTPNPNHPRTGVTHPAHLRLFVVRSWKRKKRS